MSVPTETLANRTPEPPRAPAPRRSNRSPLPRIDPTDGELLALFTRHGDHDALDRLVDRHAAMVWRVCRQTLRRPQDAEDAFQATFLLLMKGAGAIRSSDSAAGWLCRVAYRTSIRARKKLAARREESLAVDPDAPSEAAFPDLLRKQMSDVLVEELMQLPARYRTPLVLRYLEGRSRRAIADQTDTTVASVQGRLARGKQLLRRRLLRRGVSLSAAMAAVGLAGRHAGADQTVPAQVLAQTTSNAVVVATGGSLAASAAVVGLYHQGVRAMFLLGIAKPAGVAASLAEVALLAIAPTADGDAPIAAADAPFRLAVDLPDELDASPSGVRLARADVPTTGERPPRTLPKGVGDSLESGADDFLSHPAITGQRNAWRPGDADSIDRLRDHQHRLTVAIEALQPATGNALPNSERVGRLLAAHRAVSERIAATIAEDDYVDSILEGLGLAVSPRRPAAKTPNEPTLAVQELLESKERDTGVTHPIRVGGSPTVVETVPKRGALHVDPNLREVRVTFDRDMSAGGYSFTGSAKSGMPEVPRGAKPVWIDRRTCVLPVRLEPGRAYRVGINAPSYKNFKSIDGVAAAIDELRFTTAAADYQYGANSKMKQGQWNCLHRPTELNPAGWATVAELRAGEHAPIKLPDDARPRPHLRLEAADTLRFVVVDPGNPEDGESWDASASRTVRGVPVEAIRIGAGKRDASWLVVIRQATGDDEVSAPTLEAAQRWLHKERLAPEDRRGPLSD